MGGGVPLIKGVREGLEVVVVEVPIEVEGHGGGAVTELALHGLDAGAGGDHHGRRTVAEVVHSQTRVDPGGVERRCPHIATEVGGP